MEGLQFSSYGQSRSGEFGSGLTCNWVGNLASLKHLSLGVNRLMKRKKQDDHPTWWFLFRSQPGRQGLALSGQTEHL